MTTRVSNKVKLAIGIGTLIGMLFTAWFFVDDRHAQAEDLDAEVEARKAGDEESQKLILAESLERAYGDEAKALDAAQAVLEARIEQKEMALEDIEQRQQDGVPLSSDETRRARLQRDLDKLLTRQDKLLDKQNSLGVTP